MTLRQWHDQAAAAFQQGRPQETERLCGMILQASPGDFLGHYLLGLVRHDQTRFGEALTHLDLAVAARPGDPQLLFNRGNTLFALGRLDEALAGYERSVALAPGFAPAWNNRGNALREMGRLSDAVASYSRVLGLDPGALPVRRNRAETNWQLQRVAEALMDYETIVRQEPGLADNWRKRGDLLRATGQVDAALASYQEATRRDPGLAGAWLQWGSVLWLEKAALAEALVCVERAVALDSNLPYAQGLLAHLKAMACDWRGMDAALTALDAGVRAGRRVIEPFAYLPLSPAPADLKICAETFVRDRYPAQPHVARPPRGPRTRIRLGYLSGEFHEQATAHLTAGLYEHHDRDRFEVVAFDNGPDDGSPMRQRLLAAFDRHVDVSRLPPRACAERIAAEDVDILITLNGLFGRHRTDALALRPAPLQVSYLGFPGTMGADYIDYLIADGIVIPPGEEAHYTEQIVRLPHSYQINDNKRAVAPPHSKIIGRTACGLPQDAFVFCNFNNAYKHNPDSFALWLRLLGQVDGSVLWLLESNTLAPDHLRREAAAAGIAPQRLIFAPFVPAAQNLARLACADLSLDSLPYNAHTTASDALWAGLPLLTCRGNAFSGRVAASLLTAAGLPDLITQNAAEYEKLAIKLAREPALLRALRDRLTSGRSTAPLFDTGATTRALERAYARMWDMHQRDETPRGFAVAGPEDAGGSMAAQD